MRKTVFTCDHCGKELDEMYDYNDIAIDDFAKYVETDLCAECYNELSNIILQYINKETRL